MCETYLFKGQLRNSEEWVYGRLLADDIIVPCDQEFYVSEGYLESGLICHEVDPETIGQFTGYLDKNNNKIFEGDILVIKTIDTGTKRFALVCKGEFLDSSENQYHVGYYLEVTEDDETFCLSLLSGKVEGYSISKSAEVIGNYHDDPIGSQRLLFFDGGFYERYYRRKHNRQNKNKGN